MRIRYFGHSAIAFEVGDHCVAVDPFLTGNPLYGKMPENFAPTSILISHGHEDHVGDAVELSRRHRATITTSYELANHLRSLGAEVNACGMGGRVSQPWGWSKLVPAWHSSSMGGQYMGNPCGIILNFGEHVVYFAGDTCVFSDMKLIAELYQPTIACLPMGGHFTMDIFEAVKAVEFIKPSLVIPLHFGTWPPLSEDPQEFKRQVESKGLSKVTVMKPDEVLHVSLQAK